MNKLTIKNKLNRDMTGDINEWEKGFNEVDNEKHWVKGYSAQSLGEFFASGEGQIWLDNLCKSLFGSEIVYGEAEIEHQSKLDSYGGRHRMQDLAIWGTLKDKKVFVGIEAKVLESFGNYSVRDEYEVALQYRRDKNIRSKKPNRVEEIVDFLFPNFTPYDQPARDLRYQLLHYLTASLKEGNSLSNSKKPIDRHDNPDIVLLPVLVFQTKRYKENPDKARLNKADYEEFCKALEFENIEGSKVRFRTIKDISVYTLYEEIPL